MGEPGSTNVQPTGTGKIITQNKSREIDRYKIDRVTVDYLNDEARVRILEGFVDPETLSEVFVVNPGTFPIDNLSSTTTRFVDGVSFSIPSGTYFDTYFKDRVVAPADDLQENIEDAVFDAFTAMGYFLSGTEVPA